MLCDVKRELLMAYQRASDVYSKAVSQLVRHTGSVSANEYKQLRLMAERARQGCIEARDALSAHTYEHHC
jgi:hypothetical protein